MREFDHTFLPALKELTVYIKEIKKIILNMQEGMPGCHAEGLKNTEFSKARIKCFCGGLATSTDPSKPP